MAKRNVRNVVKNKAKRSNKSANRVIRLSENDKKNKSKIRKSKETKRRNEIVLEILDQIKNADTKNISIKPANKIKIQTKTKGKRTKQNTIETTTVSPPEPHLENEIMKKPIASAKTPAPKITNFGPELAKKRVTFKPISLIKTGVSGLDEMCSGGIEERSIVLINGDAGSGKTILGLQFLYEGAKNGEATLYISFGEPRESVYPRMQEFGMDFQSLEDRQKFFFVEYQPHEVARIMQEEGGTIYDIITAYKIKRVVVDTITPYLMQFNDAYSARLALVRFFNVFRKFGATTVLLNEWSSHMPVHPSAAVAEFLSDGVVYLIHARSNEGVQIRGIEIWKMLGVDHTEVARPFAFTKKGIVVYPNERLFISHETRIKH